MRDNEACHAESGDDKVEARAMTIATIRSARVQLKRIALEFCAVDFRYRRNFVSLSGEQERLFKEILTNWIRDQHRDGSADDCNRDLGDHMYTRMRADRFTTIPWLMAAAPLRDATILEIGTGTGASTVTLAEQGAIVTGIDIDEKSLSVAKARCNAYGLPATLDVLNAVDVADKFPTDSFDFVIFFASIEHMTYNERLSSIRAAWNVIRPSGILCITGTPNRLWHLDFHTSILPFFNWLPDELAIMYAHKSPRREFATANIDCLSLARWGRCFSFHELELAIGELDSVRIFVGKRDFLRRRNPLMLIYDIYTGARRYERILERTYSSHHCSFYRQFVDVMLQKPPGLQVH